MFELSAAKLLQLPCGSPDAVEILAPIGLQHVEVANRRLLDLAKLDTVSPKSGGFEDCLPVLLTLLMQSAIPDESLVNFERYANAVEDPGELFVYLTQNPRGTEILIRLFVGSRFLTEILLRNPTALQGLTIQSRISEIKSREQFREEAIESVAEESNFENKISGLRRYQQQQILRIGTCDAFGLMDLKSVTLQLSLLAGGLIQACLHLSADDLKIASDGFAVIAMGKLGGEELNYSSDIDLVFLADGDATRFWPLARKLIHALSARTPEGFLYRVDMRLRPWGQSGALVNTIAGHIDYLSNHGAIWEKQALVKAKYIAGEYPIAKEFLHQVPPIVYSMAPDEVQTTIREMRAEAMAKNRHDGPAWGDVKTGPGSIRDIEFVTQYLQLLHGDLIPDVRSPNTLDALIRLSGFDVIHAAEYRLLTSGYILLRTVEHSLQLLENKQTHVLPTDQRQLTWLARRLDFPNAEQFLEHCETWCGQIRAIYNKFLVRAPEDERDTASESALLLDQHLAKMEPSYTDTFSDTDIRQHADMLSKVTSRESIETHVRQLVDELWQLTVVGQDHPGDLSVMSGLLFAHQFDIVHGNVFTDVGRHHDSSQRMFVNVFTLRPLVASLDGAQVEKWDAFIADLHDLLAEHRTDDRRTAQSRLAKRVAKAVIIADPTETSLYPVEIEIDNDASDSATVLHIRSDDTIGFLYELSNAMTLSDIDIQRVAVSSADDRVFDTLYVTDLNGDKIESEERLQQLRAAIVLIKHFTHLLPRAPDPERALSQFHDFVGNLFEREDWVTELSSLESPDVLNALAKLLGVSSFLWNDFLRLQHENLFPVVRDVEKLSGRFTIDELQTMLAEQLEVAGEQEHRATLNLFKDRQLFRTDMRHILGVVQEFGDFSNELTDIAEVVVNGGFQICRDKIEAKFGRAKDTAGDDCAVAIFALGKCGGRELGFASDIELMFVYSADGETGGDRSLAASDLYRRMIQKFSQLLETKQEGIFQIDLRLRPYGQAGPLAVSLDAFQTYFGADGAAWPFERQALIKMRGIGGDDALIEKVMASRDACVYRDQPFDFVAMQALREKQIRQMVSGGVTNAKLSPGGLVDCEYLVQALQQENGHRSADLRTTNTLQALEAIRFHAVMPGEQCAQLADAYVFLRRLIDALRMVRGNAKDLTVPARSSEEFEFLARRLGYVNDPAQLAMDVERHFKSTIDVLHRWRV
ncbi:glutamine synthetase adenylyltransferase [bacterium]|nr:glutamine synthetase adenylyltransferase [bacterium]